MTSPLPSAHPMKPLERNVWILLTLFLLANIAFWFYSKDLKSRWINVPPVPSTFSAASSGLGDTVFAYRSLGITIQNLGDIGGRSTALKDYNMEDLGRWFMLLHKFDPHSNFLPFIASYYFGGTPDPSKLRPIIDYLAVAGNSPEEGKWRWLGNAAYLARFQMKDLDLAERLAAKIALIDNPDIPYWARNMHTSILNARGEKEAAYNMAVNILKSSSEKMHPNEVNAMRDYICTQILTPIEAENNSLCK